MRSRDSVGVFKDSLGATVLLRASSQGNETIAHNSSEGCSKHVLLPPSSLNTRFSALSLFSKMPASFVQETHGD